MTAALSSIALDYLAPMAIANPESAPSNPAEAPDAAPEADITPVPAQSGVAAPEAIATQEFSQPNPSVEQPSTPIPAAEEQPSPTETADLDAAVNPSQTPSVETAIPESPVETSPVPENPTAQRLSVSERLARLVEQDRPEREARLRENLTKSALYYAHVGDFAQARRTAQNPALPAESQAALLTEIDAIEADVLAAPPSETAGISDGSAVSAEPPLNIQDQIPAEYLRQLGSTRPQVCKTAEVDQIATPTLNLRGQYPDMLYSLVERAQQYRVQRNISKCKAVTPVMTNISYQPLLMQAFQTMTYPLAIVAEITSRFGWRIHPITGDRRFHHGVDFGAPYGTPVLAALSGQVVTAEFMDGYGLTVVLEHSDPSQRTLYAHLSNIAVEPGTNIQQGQVIGWVGSTGNSTGPHLHFEIHTPTQTGWVAIDPMIPQDAVIANR